MGQPCLFQVLDAAHAEPEPEPEPEPEMEVEPEPEPELELELELEPESAPAPASSASGSDDSAYADAPGASPRGLVVARQLALLRRLQRSAQLGCAWVAAPSRHRPASQ